ncbi:RNA polymerase sigma factor [Plantactinospora sp. WMMB334]|uniref:RNA polymerase sigma factor n=1 Tax=Plantactinospora sp. WMMB334 TaxID=3404119 RepID=UPI003B92EABE
MGLKPVFDTGSAAVDGDSDAVLRSRSDPECFAAIFDRYFTALHNYAARRLGRAGADDVAAEAFLVAFRQRASFDPRRGSVRSWLYGIATNLIREHCRDEERRYRAHSRAAAEPNSVEDTDRVDARIAASSARDRLVAALAGLSPEDRDTLLLVVWAGLSHQETSGALGVPVGTVGSRLHRVRRQLRAALDDADPIA